MVEHVADFEIAIVAKPKHAIIYDLAKEFGSITNLANELGVSPTTVGSWINMRFFPDGKRARGITSQRREEVAAKLVQLTGRPIDEIFPNWVREKLGDIPREIVSRQRVQFLALSAAKDVAGALPSPMDVAVREELAGDINDALRTLTERERVVVKMRYGLDGRQGHTLEQASARLGVGRERIRQIEAKALYKLAQPRRGLAKHARDIKEGTKCQNPAM